MDAPQSERDASAMNDLSRKPENNREPSGRKPIVQEHVGPAVPVIVPRDQEGAFLVRELQRLRVRVRQIWPMPESVPSDADVIYCEYAVDLARRLPWIPGDALAHATPDAVLSRPLTANAVLASLVLARSQFRYEQRLRSKIERLDEN